MKTIAFVTQKGGAGKSTLTASLAVSAMQAGEKVAVLDLDQQQSLVAWSKDRTAEKPAVDYLESAMVAKLPDILKELEKRGYTVAMLDTAGIDSTGTHLAMQVADLCVIPSRPTTMDLRATKATYEASVRMNKPFIFVLNQCPPQPNNPRAGEASSALRVLGLLALPLLMQRADHQDAFASGMGVTEYAPQGKASEEIKDLWDCLNNEMEEDHGKTRKTKLVG